MKIKLTGKFAGSGDSSFMEFEVDRLPTNDESNEISENSSCYEAIWFGPQSKGVTFENTMMLGLDYMESEDLDILRDLLDEDGYKIVKRKYDEANTIIF